jgi:hypothetical protein
MLCFEYLTVSDTVSGFALFIAFGVVSGFALFIAFGVHMFFHHHCDTSNGSQIPHKDLQEN